MPTYRWHVQPLPGRFGDPSETDWTVLYGTKRLRGMESQAKAKARAIQMAREVAEDVPPGSDLIVDLVDFPFGDTPDVELWRMTTKPAAGRVKRAAPRSRKSDG